MEQIPYSPLAFLEFIKFSNERGIKLANVEASFLRELEEMEEEVISTFKNAVNQSVISLRMFNSDCLPFGWDNLEEIITCSRLLDYSIAPFTPPLLPKLTSLFIRFDSYWYCIKEHNKLDRLLSMLFPLYPYMCPLWRASLTNLILCFDHGCGEPFGPAKFVEATRIVKNAPNLMSLTLVKWNIDNFNEIFQGLPNLEELWIDDCRTFTDEALIGSEFGSESDPIFHKLNRLKKLTIVGLDLMTGLTDKAFKKVFAKMSLTELSLCSKEPVSNVSAGGIVALAAGPFGSSVRKFSFRNFSLVDVSPEEFQILKMIFPCNR